MVVRGEMCCEIKCPRCGMCNDVMWNGETWKVVWCKIFWCDVMEWRMMWKRLNVVWNTISTLLITETLQHLWCTMWPEHTHTHTHETNGTQLHAHKQSNEPRGESPRYNRTGWLGVKHQYDLLLYLPYVKRWVSRADLNDSTEDMYLL